MKKFVLLFVGVLGFSQNYQIGHTTITFVDATRGNRAVATEIYYPADVAGDNVAVTQTTTDAFPVLSFGHGFVMTWDAYQNFWTALVPKGYIMVFPKTEGSFSPSHLEFGKDLAFVLTQMNNLGTTSTSIFYNRIAVKNAVMGHSMGGGASFLAAQLNSNISTIVNFAAAETNPSAIQAAATLSIPALIIAGANDCVSPPASNQVAMYNALVSSCKTYISITGASHCQMANSNSLCSFGEATCSPQATITRAAQHAKIVQYVLTWLDYQLKDNCNQGTVFDTQIVADTAISYQKNCVQCNALLTQNYTNEKSIHIYPNPVKDAVTILGIDAMQYSVLIYDIHSKLISSSNFVGSTTIDTSLWASGTYTYYIKSADGKINTGKFIKD